MHDDELDKLMIDAIEAPYRDLVGDVDRKLDRMLAPGLSPWAWLGLAAVLAPVVGVAVPVLAASLAAAPALPVFAVVTIAALALLDGVTARGPA